MKNSKIFLLIFFLSIFCLENISAFDFETFFALQKIQRKNPNAVPTLKAMLIICDDYASAENNKIAKGVRTDLATISQMLDILEKRGIVKVDKHVIQGKKATLDGILKEVGGVQSSPDDIILVYFSGHGGMQNKKTFLYTSDEKFLQRSVLEDLIKAKTSRLKMVVTDACSNDIGGGSSSRSLARNANAAQLGEYDKFYKDLFLNYEGLMHLSASSEGEYAWSDDDHGGFFTHYFFKEGIIKNPSGKWEDVFKFAKDKTLQTYNQMPASQRSQLAGEGIKGQTAKAFSLAKMKANTVTNTNQGYSTDTNNSNNKQNIGTTTTTVPTKTDNTTTVPTKPNNTNTTTIANKPIIIKNNTTKIIKFYLDGNTSIENWSEANYVEKKIDPNNSLTVNQRFATISFDSEGEKLDYDLEAGTYFFDYNQDEYLDLFPEIKGRNSKDIAKKDFNKILQIGTFEWEDEDGVRVSSIFNQDGTFIDTYPDNGDEIDGTWEIIKTTIDNRKETILRLSFEDEELSYEIEYFIDIDEEDVDFNTVTLSYFQAYDNGMKISYKQACEDEQFNPVLVMYRK
jgi:hypothetical protein